MHWTSRVFVSFVSNAGLFWFLSHEIFPESFQITGGVPAYLIIGSFSVFLNTFLRPILNIITFPLRLITLGFISFFLNGLMLWIVQYLINFLEIPEITFTIDGFLTYILAGLFLGVSNFARHLVFK